ncbi:uncharacterized protein METZ01_LOCUS364496 [marine metagenome]|uniref:Uncharacterized protein n=1 Tax=marine metagenome TaxID=408172 RepID=A0A382SQ06_9ZZZZ
MSDGACLPDRTGGIRSLDQNREKAGA